MNGDVKENMEVNMAELLDFPGKEMRESIIAGRRSPPRVIRIAVGVGGVYTLQNDADKVINHWSFKDIKDYNYTGYSFTLTLLGNTNFHIRTNDGPTLSHWIDLFRKNPDKAVVEAREFKSLDTTSTNVYHQPKYFTLDTRKSHSGKHKSRMLNVYGVDQKPYEPLQISTLHRADPSKSFTHRWSTGATAPLKSDAKSRNSARCASVDTLEISGVDTKREMRSKSEELEKIDKDSHQEEPVKQNGAMFVSRETKEVKLASGDNTQTANPSSSGSISTPPTEKESSDECPPAVPPRLKKDKRRTSSSSSSHLDDNDDIIMIKITDKELDQRTLANPPRHKPHAYETVEISSRKQERQKNSRESAYTYNHLLPKEEDPGSDYDHLIPGKKSHMAAFRNKAGKSGKNSKSELASKKVESEESNYHLSPPGERKGVRRNESLPPMRARSLTGESVTSTTDEQSGSSDVEDVLTELSPSMGACSMTEGVVSRRRNKKSDDSDPFMDLLFAPPSASRLRWSQELNPLYDYILGGKVSPAIGYDATLAPTPENSVLEDDIQEPRPSESEENWSLGTPSEQSGDSHCYDRLLLTSQSAPNTLQRQPNRHMRGGYEEVVIKEGEEEGLLRVSGKNSRPMSDHYATTGQLPTMAQIQDGELQHTEGKAATIASPLKRVKMGDSVRVTISPRLGKRAVHRRSKTVRSSDDSNAPQRTQRAQRVANTMKDFSYIAREYRLFYIKLPNGQLVTEIVNINRPVSILIEKLMDLLGCSGCDTDTFNLYVEGAVLTTAKEATLDFGEITSMKPHAPERSPSSSSLMHLVDSNSLPDQGADPIILKPSLSLRMQGITTSRIFRLDDIDEEHAVYPKEVSTGFDFHKNWLGIVQGNQPVTLDDAVKLAALQYQAYFLERTAENSVIGFCRPTEFVPAEYVTARSIEQRMYKEQERLKSKSHSDIQRQYTEICSSLPTSNTVYFPVREARKRLLQSARLRPILFGVNKYGISRVCPKSKEVLEFWEYQVLKNWAYSRRTFVLAFNNKNYPIESNQAKWISELVDFFVEALVGSGSVGSPL